nr:hypothetical protein CFP56_03351 [Quercus suber]
MGCADEQQLRRIEYCIHPDEVMSVAAKLTDWGLRIMDDLEAVPAVSLPHSDVQRPSMIARERARYLDVDAGRTSVQARF